ncbi:unnamed protein product [Ilex paraguariensis]|uniref:Dof zinc finger protein n=1 Tax=Ilex paraguariensis TaxID=185542 RepID=A0ABC8QPV3_9AQUA
MVQCSPRSLGMERRWKSNVEVAPNCPRCASSNTKFCYYNNYSLSQPSLSQPRYFCKGCRRYWTKGGSLRNVPVGGGCRKNRRAKSSKSPFHAEQPGMSNVHNLSSHGQSGGDPLVLSPRRASEPSQIDLAAVFANYLNQDSGFGNKIGGDESSIGANSSSNSTPNSLDLVRELEDVMIECQETQFLSGLPQVFVGEENVDGAMVHDPNAFELQSLLGDGLEQENSWPDGPSMENFGWQQEFGTLSTDDQLRISANLISNNWSSFDLSDYEIFSRP